VPVHRVCRRAGVEHEIRRVARPCEGASEAPSALSIPPLRRLHAFDGGPIHQVISLGPYSRRMGDLILRWASHLDAFSAYPHRTTATEQCPGQDNSSTGGPFAPVLSY
jgi:hypothetical protein